MAAAVEAGVEDGGNGGVAVEISSAGDVESDVSGTSVSITAGVEGEADGTSVVKVSGGAVVSSIAVVGLSVVSGTPVSTTAGVEGAADGMGVVKVSGGALVSSFAGLSVVGESSIGVSLTDDVGSSVVPVSGVVEESVGGSGAAVGGTEAVVVVDATGLGLSLTIICSLHHCQLQQNRQSVSLSGHTTSSEGRS